MASLLPNYEYDIFISYRHNDNRTGGVTEFVEHLKAELAATIKEPLSIYFDTNPHDGLLENHDVDKSLERKLKCLIFIPIISQTYCDPKSFAWQHEFVPFNKLAKEDSLSRDVVLSNGNVASRILPVKIHELDAEDTAIIEQEIGGVLRAIEFIYKEPGVNRPLKITDKKEDNQNHTDYHNQVNKVANAIKEITSGIKSTNRDSNSFSDPQKEQTNKLRKVGLAHSRKKTMRWMAAVALAAIAVLAYFLLTFNKQLTTLEEIDKSIAVLPFVNISDDPDQEFFCDGLTEEIISQLSNVQNLTVISRSSSMSFKGTRKTLKEIANELNVNFILEGSIRRSNNNLLITAQLIDAKRDIHIWSNKFNGTLDDVFDIQEKVSRSIIDELKIKLTPGESLEISQRSFVNPEAYEYYLRAKPELFNWNEASILKAHQHLQNGLDLVGPNPILYGGMAYVYWSYANLGINASVNFEKSEEFIRKTFALDPDSPEAHMVQGLLFQTRYANQAEAIRSFNRVIEKRPYDSHVLTWLGLSYVFCGDMSEARSISNKLNRVDPLSTISKAMPHVINFYEGRFNDLSKQMLKIYEMEKENTFWKYFVSSCLLCEDKQEEAIQFIDSNLRPEKDAMNFLTYALKYATLNMKDSVIKIINNPVVNQTAKIDCQYSQFASAICARAGLYEESILWLENAINRGFTNYHFLSLDPSYHKLKNDPRFERLIKEAQIKWNEIDNLLHK